MFAEEVANREVAQKIYQLRTKAGTSQAELARRVGASQPVISAAACRLPAAHGRR